MTAIGGILDDFSVEITGKDAQALHEARRLLPAGTRVNVTFLGNENLQVRRTASVVVKADGFTPVPHISARRLRSHHALENLLGGLQSDGTSDHVFVVAGDPPQPAGPFDDALTLIKKARLGQYGVQTISISGYPEGHPDIADELLQSALTGKAAALAEQGNAGSIVTQFGFDVDAVIAWIEAVRGRGIDLPIRVGVPGPAGVKRLASYARRFGVVPSAGIAQKYGFSLTNLLTTTGPDRFIADLAARADPSVHGTIRLHFYTFGGVRATAEWVRNFAS